MAAAYVGAAIWSPTASMLTPLGIFGCGATLSGVLMLGAARQGRLSVAARVAAGALLLLPVLGFGLAWLLPAESASGPLWLGLPRRAAIVLLGVGLLPFAILPVAYLRDPDPDPLDAAALARLRAEAERLRGREE